MNKWLIEMSLGLEKTRQRNFEGLQPIFSIEDHDISRCFSYLEGSQDGPLRVRSI